MICSIAQADWLSIYISVNSYVKTVIISCLVMSALVLLRLDAGSVHLTNRAGTAIGQDGKERPNSLHVLQISSLVTCKHNESTEK